MRVLSINLVFHTQHGIFLNTRHDMANLDLSSYSFSKACHKCIVLDHNINIMLSFSCVMLSSTTFPQLRFILIKIAAWMVGDE